VSVGDQISVRYRFGGNAGGPRTPSELLVSDADGDTLAWVGDAQSTADLTPPEDVDVRDAAQDCVHDDGCGHVKRDGFRVRAGGDEAMLGYGEQVDVGVFTALHAGNDRTVTGEGVQCSDWFPDHAEIAVVRKRTKH
jgi:hypothetical protein